MTTRLATNRARFLAAAVAGFLISAPAFAYATYTYRSYHVSSCQTYTGATYLDYSTGQIWNQVSTGTMNWFCPVLNDETHDLTASSTASTLTLYGWANAHGSLTNYAFICRTYASGGGGVCGTSQSTPNSQNWSLSFLANVPNTNPPWSGGSRYDGYWAEVYLGGMYSSSNNDIFSYYVDNGL